MLADFQKTELPYDRVSGKNRGRDVGAFAEACCLNLPSYTSLRFRYPALPVLPTH